MNEKNRNVNYNWGLLSKYRGTLMGIAIIWIMCHHGTQYGIKTPYHAIDSFLHLGSIGVDLFLIVSGVGLYFSYTKDNNIGKFYWKRFVRIVLPYICLAAPYWYWQDIHLGKTWYDFWQDFTTVSFWKAGNLRVWYISFILVMYALFPLFYHFMYPKKAKTKHTSSWRFFILIMACTIFSWYSERHGIEIYQNAEIAFNRIPAFLLGIYLGRFVWENKAFEVGELLFISILGMAKSFCAGAEFHGFIERYYWTCFILFLIVYLVILLEYYQKNISKYVLFVLNKAGELSLELYLSHVLLRRVFLFYLGVSKKEGVDLQRWEYYFFLIVIAVVISVILSIIIKPILRILMRKRKMKVA